MGQLWRRKLYFVKIACSYKSVFLLFSPAFAYAVLVRKCPACSAEARGEAHSLRIGQKVKPSEAGGGGDGSDPEGGSRGQEQT